MTDFDIDVEPGDVWEELNSFNCDFFDEQLKLELNLDKKYIKISLEEPSSFEPAENSKFCNEDLLEI